jgi:hypothetical protein
MACERRSTAIESESDLRSDEFCVDADAVPRQVDGLRVPGPVRRRDRRWLAACRFNASNVMDVDSLGTSILQSEGRWRPA